MALARDIAEAALKAEAVADKIALAGAHERLARSVRLSIQLCETLERNARDEARAHLADASGDVSAMERGLKPQLALRKAQVRAAVRRSIEQEAEGEDAELLEAALHLLVEEQALEPRFLDRPASEVVGVVRDLLRLPDHLTMWLPDPKAGDLHAAPPDRPDAAGPS